MKRAWAGLALAALLFAAHAEAKCPLGRGTSFALGYRANAYDAGAFIDGFNNAWLYPNGGWTLYPGQAGSGFGSHSDYSHVYWLTTPEQSAAAVRAKLAAMGIPQVRPEPIFLGKNPRAVDDIKLPLPRKKPDPKD